MLQARMQRLRGPTLTPADRALLDRLSGPSPNQVWTILSDGVRLAVSSLAFALAFAAGAQRRLSPEPLLLEWSRAVGRWKRLLPMKLGSRQKHSTNDPGRYCREIESRDP